MEELDFKPKTKKGQLKYECMKELIRIEALVYQKSNTIYKLRGLRHQLYLLK